MAALLVTFGTTGAIAQQTVTIIGNVKGDLKGTNQIYVYGNGLKSDTAIINNGSFKMTIPFTKPFTPLFYSEYDAKIKKGVSPFGIVIDRPGTVVIKDIDIEKGIYSGKVSGIKSAEEHEEFGRLQAELNVAIKKELQKKYGEKINAESPEYPAYAKEWEALSNKKTAVLVENFIKAHPSSFSSAYILASTGKYILNAKDLERNYKLLSKTAQEFENAKSVANYIKGLKSAEAGQYVSNFTLLTPEEKSLSFNELKGKYVWIDFWASWCGPCKASFPHMKELYQKFKGDKFEIYSISVDANKSEWLKELKKQELPWLQTLDTKSISISNFAVSAVPTSYLVGPDGKIIMKEIGFNPDGSSPLEKKLNELFGDKGSK